MIAVQNLVFHYARSTFTLRVPELSVADGEKVALAGPSGSGKTTLLHLLAGILLPDQGTIMVGDTEPPRLSDAGRRAFRIATLGLVFQDFQLLEYLDVYENILLPYRINPALNLTLAVRARALQLARETGIDHRLTHRPGPAVPGGKAAHRPLPRAADATALPAGRRADGQPRFGGQDPRARGVVRAMRPRPRHLVDGYARHRPARPI